MKAWLALLLAISIGAGGGPALAQTSIVPNTRDPQVIVIPVCERGCIVVQSARKALDDLNRDLFSHDSATAVLQGWCDHYGPGGLKITAERVRGQDKPPPEQVTAVLNPRHEETLLYRRVRLTCGARVLSEADNWYRPLLLTAEMNRVLDKSDTPFGVAVRALGFRRRNLAAEVLWGPSDGLPIPSEVLQHRAVLMTSYEAPFSYVIETYTGQALEMALPR